MFVHLTIYLFLDITKIWHQLNSKDKGENWNAYPLRLQSNTVNRESWLSKSRKVQSVRTIRLSTKELTHRIHVKRVSWFENSLSIFRRNSPNLRFARTRISLSVRVLSPPMHGQAIERIHVKVETSLVETFEAFVMPCSHCSSRAKLHTVWGMFAKSSLHWHDEQAVLFIYFFFISF